MLRVPSSYKHEHERTCVNIGGWACPFCRPSSCFVAFIANVADARPDRTLNILLRLNLNVREIRHRGYRVTLTTSHGEASRNSF